MSFTLDTSVVDLFRSTTASPDASPSIRTLLVQTSPTAKKLELTKQLPPRSSDKEDFETSLPSLFEDEPTRSGYALFRLDSQAANGDWEWLCVAYQPDGAKVKEKMQYTATRTALMGALDEHRFLDTIHSAGPRDFTFPTNLRNARKHDYQNPQQKTAGRPAAEAAGTDAGGARRMFGGRAAAPASTPKAVESEATELKAVETAATKSAAPLAAMEAAAPPTEAKEDSADAPIAPSASGLPAADPSDVVAGRQAAAEEEAKAAEPTPAAEVAAAAPTPKAATPDLTSESHEQAAEESKAPEEPPTPAPVAAEIATSEKDNEAAEEELSKPLVPSPETAKRQLTEGEHSKSNGEVANVEVSKPKEEEQLAKEDKKDAAPQKVEPAPAAATNAAPSSASAAASSAAPPSSSSSAPPPAGAAGSSSSSRPAATISRPLEWPADVEAALSGLATRVSGSSEHNFVPLHLDTSTRSISLTSDSPPRFLPPGDLSESVRNEASAVDGEETTLALAVYRYPIEVNARKVAFLYSSHGGQQVPPSLRAKLLDEVQDHVAELSGLEIERASLPGTGSGEGGASSSGGAGSAAAEYGPYPRPSPAQAEEVASRITEIQRRVDAAASASSSVAQPRLVAVSKLHPPSSIMAAHIRCSHMHFGENYVQELVDKARVLPRELRWHFVGGLQSNKAKVLAGVPNLFCLETLDSVKAAGALQKALSGGEGEAMQARRECGLGALKVFIQVNTSGEEAKSGVKLPTDGEENGELEALARHVLSECPSLHLAGLMTIGSAANSKAASADGKTLSKEEALDANPDFKALHDARASLVKALRASPPTLASSGSSSDDAEQSQGYEALLRGEGEDGGLELSMGMTADFEVAIAAGSGNVRVGTACFGQRPGSREEARKGMQGELQQARPAEKEEGGAKAGASGGGGGGVVGEKGFARPKRPGGGKK